MVPLASEWRRLGVPSGGATFGRVSSADRGRDEPKAPCGVGRRNLGSDATGQPDPNRNPSPHRERSMLADLPDHAAEHPLGAREGVDLL